jgi:hypothetical protein
VLRAVATEGAMSGLWCGCEVQIETFSDFHQILFQNKGQYVKTIYDRFLLHSRRFIIMIVDFSFIDISTKNYASIR